MPSKPITYNLGDPEDYNPITLSRRPESELRAEYTRLRRIARDRLRRIERSSDFGDSAIVRNNKAWLDVPPSKISKAELPSVLSQVEGMLEAKTGTLTGLRRQRALSIESLRASGIRGITAKNYNEFTHFMNRSEEFKRAFLPYPRRAMGSEARDAAKRVRPAMFMLTKNGNISESAILREFQFFRDNLSKIEKLVRSGAVNTSRKRPYSANELRRLLGMQPEPAKSISEARSEARARNPKKGKKRRK